VVDGEIVIAGPRGLDFDALQLRLHPAESRVRMLAAEIPATFIAFDLLALGEDDLRERPLAERTTLLRAALTPVHQVALTPQTTDPQEAASWFVRYEAPAATGWSPSRSTPRTGAATVAGSRSSISAPSTSWLAGTARTLKIEAVASLLLGLYDADGVLHHVGHTSSFSAAERRDCWRCSGPWRAASPSARDGHRGAVAMDEGAGDGLGGRAPRAGLRGRIRPSAGQPLPPRLPLPALAPRQGPRRNAGTTSCCRPTPSTSHGFWEAAPSQSPRR